MHSASSQFFFSQENYKKNQNMISSTRQLDKIVYRKQPLLKSMVGAIFLVESCTHQTNFIANRNASSKTLFLFFLNYYFDL